jgi:ubiquinone biosynthesis accessory factor UbiJ
LNPFLGSLALIPVEKILNTIVGRDPHIAKQFLAFDSKCIEIISRQPSLTLNLRFEDGAVRLSAIDTESLGIEADATISGKAETLLRLLGQKSDQRPLANAALDISGDATLVQDLQMTIESLDINWQDYLAPILGDVLSNELGAVERSAKDWGRSAGGSMRRNVRDYLSEEARLVPTALEVDSFSNRLDHLRLGIDRLEAKTELLQRRLALLPQAK